MLEELTEPDEQISADKMETLSLDLLSALPMEGVEGSPLDADVIWKTVERAATDATSVHHVIENTDETPDDDETVMDWLRTIDSDALETVVNDLLTEHATTILDSERSRIVIIDFVDNPYHGTYLHHPREICSMKPRDGTTDCHRYCTAFVLDTKKPLTLAITPVTSDEDAADAVGRVLDRVEELPFEVNAILADRGYYQERVIRRARATAPVVLPVVKKGEQLRDQLDTHASYWTKYAMYKGKERELRFPHAVCVSYQSGDRGKHGEVVRGYVACDLTDRTPKQVEALYRKRSAIETSYRTYREARAVTATPDPLIRFVFVAVSFLLRNLWLVVRWAVVARPRQGGRDLPTEFTFELVCGWIRDHLSADLGWQYTWETNGVGLPPGYDPTAA
ncbi:hypothetical protein GCM10008985_12280 [Halococcus dombrowskii]|uniref:Transposase IS4-like domain-containing protein n=2 Tax=Halococcus dombrowskii TaxID=179637 RepID=A0AAV3SEZ5_HALDO